MKALRSCVLFVLAGWSVGQSVGQDAQPAQAESKLRIEPVATYDIRVGHIGTPINERRSQFQLITRLTGGEMDEVTRLGYPIFEEFVDDTGAQLVDPGKFKGHEDETNPYKKPLAAKGFQYIDLPFKVDVPPSRKATEIAHVKGHVLVVFGGKAEPVFIPHAKRYQGGYLDDPKLDALGIRIRMLLPEEAGLDDPSNAMALAIESGQKRIRNIAVYDDWYHNTLTHTETHSGDESYTVFKLEDILFTEDCELGVYVFPNSRTERVDFDFKDIPLP